jgi:HPt (histidine-containing phosphotransfer) domain-containing protein
MVMIREESSAGDSAWSMTTELNEIMEIDPDMMPEMVSIFLSDSTLRMQALNGASVQRDFKSIRAQAHSLKGSCLQMGAARLATFCAVLELSERPEPDQCEQMTRAIGDEFDLVRRAMQEFLGNGKTAAFTTCPSEISR